MKLRRKFRPAVNGLEERLALNGTMGAAGLLAHAQTGLAAVADVKHMGSHTHTGTHKTPHGHVTHHHHK